MSRDGALRRCGMAPADPASWDRLGQILLAADEPGLAHAAFAEASVLAPMALDIALHAVEAATAAGTLTDAMTLWIDRCIADPFNVAAHTARGVVLQRLGRHDEALDAFEVASALAPDAPLPACLLGGVLARSNRLLEAEAALRHAHWLEPENADIANDLATVLMRMHRHAEARSILLRLLERSRNSVTVLCNLATATTCLGLQEEAVALAEEAILSGDTATARSQAIRATELLPRGSPGWLKADDIRLQIKDNR